jgi:RHS repeat-associated protein
MEAQVAKWRYAGCGFEPESAPALSVAVNSSNQITNAGFSYDAAGNMTADGSGSFAYDAENRMTSTAGVDYTYDGDGRRVKKDNGTLYWYGVGGEVLMETDSGGNNPKEFVFFNGTRVARRDPSGSVFYYFEDHLGSARVVADASGTVVEDSDFYPFGGERVVVSNLDNNYKFTGKERDSESGLDYFIARHYASNLGRFSSIDPIALSPQKMQDPQQFNMYAYARNNPMRYIDPDGEEIRLSDLTDEERAKLISILEQETGLALKFNEETGNLEVVKQTSGGSSTFREGLIEAINSEDVFNVINASEFNGQKVNFAGFDKDTNTVVLDFGDFQQAPQIDLGLGFFHETVGHGLKGLKDESLFGESAVRLTTKVGRELGIPYPIQHGTVPNREGKYIIRLIDPKKSFPKHVDVDVTDVIKKP